MYQVQGPDGKAMAFKAIMKDALLHQRKNRQKVLAEILIHRSLHHPNIVHFIDLFQDEANVYFKLELCSNGSMNDMVRTRGRCLDEEARFYMVQILAGTKFMHVNHVIHRDLKLGNIFLDSSMNIKIGDFGLAALLKDPEERKKTMCGTPNYIAPEILYEGNGNGHSFEVDIWSVGVILYTLLSGKPPFQTSSVPAIYEKIRKNDYTIPEYVHPDAADLIRSILTPNPSERPSLVEIMNHPWFTAGRIPLQVPSTATKTAPHLTLPRTMEESLRNLETVKRMSGWRDDADDELEEDEEQGKQTGKEKKRAQEKAEEEREKMEKEFEVAIQPGSSLAGFLQLGRKALTKAPDAAGPLRPKSLTGLSRQLSALSLSRQQSGNTAMSATPSSGKGFEDVQSAMFASADKENAGQGIGIGRMMPPPPTSSTVRLRHEAAEDRRAINHKVRLVTAMATSGSSSSLASAASGGAGRPDSRQAGQEAEVAIAGQQGEMSSLEVLVQNLGNALEAFQTKRRFVPRNRKSRSNRISFAHRPDALNADRMRPRSPRSYIICWLDEMEKYGLGYALSDGTVGVYLKDDSSIATNASRSHFDHVARLHTMRGPREAHGQGPRPDSYAVNAASNGLPREVLRKFKVLSYFEEKIDARLEGFDLPFLDQTTTSGMPFVWRWYRCMQAIVFRLSSSMVQFNFYDHTKIFFSQDGLVISAIVPDRTTGEAQPVRSWTMEEFIDIAEKTRSSREQCNQRLPALRDAATDGSDAGSDEEATAATALVITTPDERRLVRSLMSKVKYARDTLIKISAKDAATAPPSSHTATASSSRVRPTSTATLGRSNSAQSINGATMSALRHNA